MSCREVDVSLVAYAKNELTEPQNEQVAQHLQECSLCRAALDSEQALVAALQGRARIPQPSAGFEARVLAAAAAPAAQQPRGWGHGVLGGAVAAALAVGIALGVMLSSHKSTEEALAGQEVISESTATAESIGAPLQRTVRLAFRSGEALENVTLTLQLPPHVELASLPGRHELSWQVSLNVGENVLALPLRVLFPGAGELVARLDAGGRQKTFRVPIPDANDGVGEEPAS